MTCFRWVALALAALGLGGCISVPMQPATATAVTIEQLRAANLSPSTVGNFALAPGRDASMDRSVGGLRGSSVQAPSGSYAQQLKDQILAELKASGFYDEHSGFVIDGLLTDNKLDAAIGTGSGRLAARFSVTRNGSKVFDKEFAAEARWESSFVGAIAIPAAIREYEALYKALAAKLFADPEFKAALKR